MTVFLVILLFASCGARDLTSEPGHLLPFGEGRPSTPLDEIEGFPNPQDFFENYVKPLRPLKMTNAAKLSPAFFKWTDDYFLGLEEPSGHEIAVETVKKESRQQNVLMMPFKEFVKDYNNTDNYMVNEVPSFIRLFWFFAVCTEPFELRFYVVKGSNMVNEVPSFIRHDVVIPCPLQCRSLVEENFVDNVMWFSSGGTKSVVHTDSVDNINCLYRGNKTLIMVDPAKHGYNVDIDRPEGSYSAMDVDRVDYTKYPGMAQVEFYRVNITAGDCLYIPYHWIHQVRSYGSNLAVNVWWRHHLSDDLNYDECNRQCNPDHTLKDATFTGFDGLGFDPSQIRDHIMMSLGKSERLTFPKLARFIVGTDLKFSNAKEVFSQIHVMYQLLDTDKDGIVMKQEIETASNGVFVEVASILSGVDQLIEQGMEGKDEMEEEDEEEMPGDGEETAGEDRESDREEKHDEL